jgi:hypothetical protein
VPFIGSSVPNQVMENVSPEIQSAKVDIKPKVQLFVRELDGLNMAEVELVLQCVQEEVSSLMELAPVKTSNFVISS